jgi:hypothetical protein
MFVLYFYNLFTAKALFQLRAEKWSAADAGISYPDVREKIMLLLNFFPIYKRVHKTSRGIFEASLYISVLF